VPAHRIGFQPAGFSVGQLKMVQELVTLAVFVPFVLFYREKPLKLEYR